MNTKVSIIIPAYNVENEIEKALNSIQKQTHKNLEIIVIDDGSTDNTLKIVQEIARTDQRITTISQENSGQSRARNRGLELSTGEYIYFFDADDILKKNAIEFLLEKIEYLNVDLVTFNADHINKNKTRRTAYVRHDKMLENRAYTRDEFLKVNKWNLTPVWIYFFKKEFLAENKIKFIEGLIYEDNIFYMDILDHCNTIGLVNQALFDYQIRSNSTITSKDNHNYKLQSLRNVKKLIVQRIGQQTENDIFLKFLKYRVSVIENALLIQCSQGKFFLGLVYLIKHNELSLKKITVLTKMYLKKIVGNYGK